MRKTKAKIMTEKRDNAIVRKEKAITLIALIVTIIVLLILADPHIFLNIPQCTKCFRMVIMKNC